MARIKVKIIISKTNQGRNHLKTVRRNGFIYQREFWEERIGVKKLESMSKWEIQNQSDFVHLKLYIQTHIEAV
jgi:hypothetical protein